MRRTAVAALLLTAALTRPAAAQDPREAASAERVPVCDSLLALRQLAAGAGEDRTRAATQVSEHPGCRLVPRGRIGAVERRAMFGGGAYECVAVEAGGCAWVMP